MSTATNYDPNAKNNLVNSEFDSGLNQWRHSYSPGIHRELQHMYIYSHHTCASDDNIISWMHRHMSFTYLCVPKSLPATIAEGRTQGRALKKGGGEGGGRTHAQDATSEPVRVEGLKCLQFLPCANELNRLPTDFPHTERCATPTVSIHLRQNGACNHNCATVSVRCGQEVQTRSML